MELINQLFGNNSIEVWIAGLIWSFIGIMAVKIWRLRTRKRFSFKYWFNDNLLDILKGLVASLVILRLESYAFDLLREKTSIKIPATEDFVVFMIVISAIIQIFLHKRRIPFNQEFKDSFNKE